MGCGCGKRKNKRPTVNSLNSKRMMCKKCGSFMVYKQQYSPRMKKYVRVWECSNKRCKARIAG